jgi:hypothetical protein
VSFFADLPDSPHPPRHREPAWAAPPANELPVPVALELVAGRSAEAVVTLGPLQVYSIGFELVLTVRVRTPPERFFDPLHLHPHARKEDVLRFGLACADGLRAEVGRPVPRREPPERTLTPRGGGGGDNRWDLRVWSWPLPPPGPVDVHCLWPRFGIDETRTSFDAQPLLEAAARVERLWPEEGPGSRPEGAAYQSSHHLIRGDG